MFAMRLLSLILMITFAVTSAFAQSELKIGVPYAMDLATLNELNTQATQLWAQLVRESGSVEKAKYDFLYSAKADPRIVEFHANILQFAATSEYVPSIFPMKHLYQTQDAANALTLPFSPFLRQILMNVATYRAKQIYDRTYSRFSAHRVNFNESVYCALLDQCDSDYTPRYAKTDKVLRLQIRQFMVTKLFLAANVGNLCATYLDTTFITNGMRVLTGLSLDEDMISVSDAKPLKDLTKKMVPCVQAELAKQGRRQTDYLADEVILASAAKYLNGL
jgi:hypothetical protein